MQPIKIGAKSELINITSGERTVTNDKSNPPAVPIVRWVGGKSWIAPLVADVLLADGPKYNTYLEPFAGSLAVLCELANRGALPLGDRSVHHGQAPTVHIAEACPDLNLLYRVLRRAHTYTDDFNEFDSCQLPTNAEEYYALRDWFTDTNRLYTRVKDAAAFWALNRTCFQGLTRYGPNGFNVPYGTIKKPKKPDVRGLARVLANTSIYADFRTVLDRVAPKDAGWTYPDPTGFAYPHALVYLDPPYLTGVDETKASKKDGAFTEYSGKAFTYQDQQELAAYACALVEGGARVVVSNADTPEIDKLYPSSLFEVVARPVRRNSIRPDLGKASGEVLLVGKKKGGKL